MSSGALRDAGAMTPHYADDWLTVYHGDARTVLAALPAESVHCVVTSPPYWGLRDYGQEGQLGLEPTPEQYVENMVAVFRKVRRVLRSDGTVWLNLGDSYASHDPGGYRPGEHLNPGGRAAAKGSGRNRAGIYGRNIGLKPKDLVGIPWRVAFALQADGWYLRSDIIWSKPNPMPESVTDRPTKAHEYVFLLSKSARYYYDADAVREAHKWQDPAELAVNAQARQQKRLVERGAWRNQSEYTAAMRGEREKGRNTTDHKSERAFKMTEGGRNLRSVWSIATQPYPGAHFATFPPKLVEPCIKAGTSEKGVCPECGAPWVREVERHYEGWMPGGADPRQDGRPDGGERRKPPGGASEWKNYKAPTTIGWRPTCGHKEPPRHAEAVRDDLPRTQARLGHQANATTVPATVLDPFAGSGTTGMVAQSLSRRAILIDLSMDYLDQLLRRNRDIPLGLGA